MWAESMHHAGEDPAQHSTTWLIKPTHRTKPQIPRGDYTPGIHMMDGGTDGGMDDGWMEAKIHWMDERMYRRNGWEMDRWMNE